MEKEQSAVSKELNDLGFVTGKLRRGVVIGFLAVSVIGNVAQWIRQNKTSDKVQSQSEKFQEVMIRIIEQKRETEQKVDTLINRMY